LARRSGAQVLAHRDEVPYIEQAKSLPTASLAQRLLNWLGDRILFRLSPCQVDRRVEDGDVIEGLGGTQVIHTPGHTPGSICLYQPERRILFCGDALFNANPITGRPGLRLPIRLVTVDNAQARDSVGKLSTLAVEVLCCGHGEPIMDGAGEKVRALLGDENS
jgi:glyoxylase-like metal-dependent hydrolase (beta-lactamase superfamily II)